ncbi:MAG: SIR2 family protein [Candidatus Rokubacteria bacterium]|nr:SIR2 family protein [Candidatus Rokubacteria bacterium]
MEPLKNRTFKFREAVLLTGAGFTKDFGGRLADEMWAWIFNSREVQRRSAVATALRQNQSYEVVYSEIVNSVSRGAGTYGDEDREAIVASVQRAYLEQDRAIREYRQGYGDCISFLRRFSGTKQGERGYFFTLNQDLFIERICFGDLELRAPGVPGHCAGVRGRNEFDPRNGSERLPTNVDSCALTDEKDGSCGFQYVKLHGSLNWLSSDGRSAMVIGAEKAALIEDEPLLKFYSGILREVLSAAETRRLCVIGYRFGDANINEIIARSIERNPGLGLYILNPAQPGDFKQVMRRAPGKMDGVGVGDRLWEALGGYFPWSVKDVLGEGDPTRLEGLQAALFD